MVWCKQSCRRRFGTLQTDNRGSPETWEIPVRSSANFRLETPDYQLQALAAHSSTKEQMKRVNAEVPPSEGRKIMNRIWRATCSDCSTVRNLARTKHHQCAVCIFPKAVRVLKLVHWEFPRWRTRFSSGRLSCCWNRSTSRTFWTVRTDFDRGDRLTKR